MRRKIMTELQRWRTKSNRMPLLLNGARQVGKTYVLKNATTMLHTSTWRTTHGHAICSMVT